MHDREFRRRSRERWNVLQGLAATRLAQLPTEGVHALLELLAMADEACADAGLPRPAPKPGAPRRPEDEPDAFHLEATRLLARPGTSSLCRDIDVSRAVVLPKMHTPQLGMSLRSLSHHLALCGAGEVSPRWGTAPQSLDSRAVNLLAFPWPLEVTPNLFRHNPGHLANMDDDEFGFFTCEAPAMRAQLARVPSLLKEAERLVGRVDALVFPELALPSGEAVAMSQLTGKIVIAGEGTPSDPVTGDPGKNEAVVAVPLGPKPWWASQPKHHRWRVDDRQIEQYGLGSRLDPNRAWWEHIILGPREIRFWSLDAWLTFCVLICEDLARQEPVAPVVRAVGPNLVLALVMDGPQLDKRWTARYATVLADDPGSSVLALTSAGMARLSRLPGKPPSRTVALWKDGRGGTPREIDLDDGAEAIVLCLTQKYGTEWSADGRNDGGATGYVLLHGTHQVRAPRYSGRNERRRALVGVSRDLLRKGSLVRIRAVMGIDPREGTLLTLVAMRLRAGWSGEKALEGVEFGDDFVREVARGLTGDETISPDAKEQAKRIGEWAGVPAFLHPQVIGAR